MLKENVEGLSIRLIEKYKDTNYIKFLRVLKLSRVI